MDYPQHSTGTVSWIDSDGNLHSYLDTQYEHGATTPAACVCGYEADSASDWRDHLRAQLARDGVTVRDFCAEQLQACEAGDAIQVLDTLLSFDDPQLRLAYVTGRLSTSTDRRLTDVARLLSIAGSGFYAQADELVRERWTV